MNTSCIEAIHDAQAMRAQLDKLGRAAQQLNFGRLEQVVRKLEPIQSRLSADSRASPHRRPATGRQPGHILSSGPSDPSLSRCDPGVAGSGTAGRPRSLARRPGPPTG